MLIQTWTDFRDNLDATQKKFLMIQNIQENTRINTPESHIGLTAFKDYDYLLTLSLPSSEGAE